MSYRHQYPGWLRWWCLSGIVTYLYRSWEVSWANIESSFSVPCAKFLKRVLMCLMSLVLIFESKVPYTKLFVRLRFPWFLMPSTNSRRISGADRHYTPKNGRLYVFETEFLIWDLWGGCRGWGWENCGPWAYEPMARRNLLTKWPAERESAEEPTRKDHRPVRPFW